VVVVFAVFAVFVFVDDVAMESAFVFATVKALAIASVIVAAV
jgi:hypothetical protein